MLNPYLTIHLKFYGFSFLIISFFFEQRASQQIAGFFYFVNKNNIFPLYSKKIYGKMLCNISLSYLSPLLTLKGEFTDYEKNNDAGYCRCNRYFQNFCLESLS